MGVALLLIEGSLEAFDVDNLDLISLPFAVQEMVFAVWLIVKGFARPATSDDTATKQPASA